VSQVAAIILAAGTSSRFGAANKLLAGWGGQPMVRTVAGAALATELDPVIVVTGHESEQVEAALAGLDVRFVHNPDYSQGQAGSVKRGISAVPQWCDAAMILLGDMPRVCAGDINVASMPSRMSTRSLCPPSTASAATRSSSGVPISCASGLERRYRGARPAGGQRRQAGRDGNRCNPCRL
jgi:CTP:molybdopterin cytidylyltransferase MocA